MIEILLFSTTAALIFISYGIFFIKNFLLDKNKVNLNYIECGLFGIIFLSFISLLLNFFTPLNSSTNNIVAIIGLLFAIFSKNINYKIIKISFIAGCISSTLIILNNVNRPDAGLYHLPYINIINNEKIILGLSNLHSRFGHISILQYTSAIFKNSLFGTNGILIPAALISSFFILFLLDILIKNKKKILLSEYYLIFFLFIFSLYHFSNYSEYGNDVPAYIYFFFTIAIFYKIKDFKKDNYVENGKILATSIFVLLNKIFFLLILLIPIISFFLIKKKINFLKYRALIFSLIFILLWFMKNILVTGCVIYPVELTCIKKLNWLDINDVKNLNISSEAWAKGWNDQKEPRLDMEEYKSGFRWIKTWKEKHFKKILEKFFPFIIFNILIVFFFFIYKKKHKNIVSFKDHQNKFKIFFLLFLSTLGIFFWFLKFPLYRYGLAYLTTFFISSSLLILFFFSKEKNSFTIKFYNYTIYAAIFLFIIFNVKRINNNFGIYYNDYPWPKIYSFNEVNNLITYKPIFQNNKIVYYVSEGELCMYGKSPCTSYYNKEIKFKEKNNYKIFYKETN
jgi:hypothetical protein